MSENEEKLDNTFLHGTCSNCGGEIKYQRTFDSSVYPVKGEHVFQGTLWTATEKEPVPQGGEAPHYKRIYVLTCSTKCLLEFCHNLKIEDLEIQL